MGVCTVNFPDTLLQFSDMLLLSLKPSYVIQLVRLIYSIIVKVVNAIVSDDSIFDREFLARFPNMKNDHLR